MLVPEMRIRGLGEKGFNRIPPPEKYSPAGLFSFSANPPPNRSCARQSRSGGGIILL